MITLAFGASPATFGPQFLQERGDGRVRLNQTEGQVRLELQGRYLTARSCKKRRDTRRLGMICASRQPLEGLRQR